MGRLLGPHRQREAAGRPVPRSPIWGCYAGVTMCKVRLTKANIVPPVRAPSPRGAMCKLDLTEPDIATVDYLGDYVQPTSDKW